MDEIMFMVLIGMIGLYLGYVLNKWKISDLEDRVDRLERKHD